MKSTARPKSTSRGRRGKGRGMTITRRIPDRCGRHGGIFSMTDDFDLPDDPIPETWGRRDRSAHIQTREYRNKIKLLPEFGWTNLRIAQALRIMGTTLKKHYFPARLGRASRPPAWRPGSARPRHDASRARWRSGRCRGRRPWPEIIAGLKPTFVGRCPLCPRFRPLHPQEQTFLMVPPNHRL